MSTWNPDSDLMRLNRAPVNTPVLVTDELAQVLALGVAIGRASGGAFDIGMGNAHILERPRIELEQLHGLPAIDFRRNQRAKTAEQRTRETNRLVNGAKGGDAVRGCMIKDQGHSLGSCVFALPVEQSIAALHL